MKAGLGRALAPRHAPAPPDTPQSPDTSQPPHALDACMPQPPDTPQAPSPRSSTECQSPVRTPPPKATKAAGPDSLRLHSPRSWTQCTWEAGRRTRPPKVVTSRGSRSAASVHPQGPTATAPWRPPPSVTHTMSTEGGLGRPRAAEGAGAVAALGCACSSGRSPQRHTAISSLRIWPARPRLPGCARLRLLLLSTLWLGRLGTTRPQSSPRSLPILTWPSLVAPKALPRERPPLPSLSRQSHRELTAVAPQGRVQAREDPTGSWPPT